MKNYQDKALALSVLMCSMAFAAQMRVGSETTIAFQAQRATLLPGAGHSSHFGVDFLSVASPKMLTVYTVHASAF